MEENMVQEAQDYALYLLSFRERSQKEIKIKLTKKGYQLDVVDKVINHLKKINYLNDFRFTEQLIKHWLKYKPMGKYLFEYKLKKKGIDKEIISKALNSFLTDDIELDLGIKVATKWLDTHSIDEKSIIKLKRYLRNKGFSFNLIEKIVLSTNIDC